MSGRWWRVFASGAALLFCACTGGQSTDPGVPIHVKSPVDVGRGGSGGAGAGGAGGDSGGAPPPCEFELWQNPADRPQRYHCEGAISDSGEDEIECDCDGRIEHEPLPPDAGSLLADVCDDLLQRLCGVDRSVRTHCEHQNGGDCWPSPTASDAWLCDCNDGRAPTEVRSDGCYEAGVELCPRGPDTCQDSTGHCKRRTSEQFDCECALSSPDVRLISGLECSNALSVCSSPSAMACTAASGYCDPSSQGDALECHCQDGSQHMLPAPELGGTQCLTTLQMACSEQAPADMGMCSSGAFETNDGPSGHCDHNNSKDPRDGFECECLPGPDNAFEARFGKVKTTTCEQALAYFCPEAAP